jgi:dienelactone hydrolase
MEFANTAGSWEKVVKKDFVGLLEHYKAQGAKEIGAFGFCWGAKMCVEASVDFGADIKAIALIHPSMLVTEDADRVLSPTLCLPASTDFDMVYNNKIRGLKNLHLIFPL